MPPTLRLQRRFFRHWRRLGAFLCPDLVERVLAKADAFAVASGSIIGQRQALEDRLDACTTLEEVQGITVDISTPEEVEAA